MSVSLGGGGVGGVPPQDGQSTPVKSNEGTTSSPIKLDTASPDESRSSFSRADETSQPNLSGPRPPEISLQKADSVKSLPKLSEQIIPPMTGESSPKSQTIGKRQPPFPFGGLPKPPALGGGEKGWLPGLGGWLPGGGDAKAVKIKPVVVGTPSGDYQASFDTNRETKSVSAGDIQSMYKSSATGLLARTIQTKNAGSEFSNLGMSRDDSQTAPHGGMKGWSVIREDIQTNLYKFGAAAMGRDFAILSDPSQMGEKRYVRFSATDASSGHSLNGRETLSQEDGLKGLQKLNTKLAASSNKDNSEVETFGMDPDAVVGFLVTDRMVEGQGKDFIEKQLQPLIDDVAGDAGPSNRSEFHVFTRSESGKNLNLVTTLKPNTDS